MLVELEGRVAIFQDEPSRMALEVACLLEEGQAGLAMLTCLAGLRRFPNDPSLKRARLKALDGLLCVIVEASNENH